MWSVQRVINYLQGWGRVLTFRNAEGPCYMRNWWLIVLVIQSVDLAVDYPNWRRIVFTTITFRSVYKIERTQSAVAFWTVNSTFDPMFLKSKFSILNLQNLTDTLREIKFSHNILMTIKMNNKDNQNIPL